MYLPYINGERAPIWDANARGVFFGFGAGHTKAHFFRAVLEGVSFSLKQSLEIIHLHGRGDAPVKISGAAADNSGWNQIKADILQVPVHTTLSRESSCLGAAIIAAVGSGYFTSFEEATAAMTGIDSCWEPDSTKKPYYDELFGIYKNLYPDLRENYIKAAEARKLV